MVSLLECDDYEDFIKYTGCSICRSIHPDDLEPMKKNSAASWQRNTTKNTSTSSPTAW